ncbi:MAG: hypothetical protein PHQ52_03585 [Candidatus Omnitrophica bacterium]|nr:hypothetical protein [Candidatus Omnitrophota bacterium]
MNKIIAVIMVSMFISISCFAHPPKNIILDYNKETGQLDIIAEHNVTNPKVHNIKEIVVKAGDKGYFLEEFPQQSSEASEKLTVNLPDLKKGDEIEVTAKCGVYGKKTVTLVVE